MHDVVELYLLSNNEELNDLIFERVRICKRLFFTSGTDELKFKDIFDGTVIHNPKKSDVFLSI